MKIQSFKEMADLAIKSGHVLAPADRFGGPTPAWELRPPTPPRPRLQRLEGPGQWRHDLIIDLVESAEDLNRARRNLSAMAQSINAGAHLLSVYRVKWAGLVFDEQLEIFRALGKAV
jgi:hypothetical protein